MDRVGDGMSAPQRIRRERTKGWRMPEGAVYVGRPSRWGNPFRALPCTLTKHDDIYHEIDGRHWHVATVDETYSLRWPTEREAIAWAVKYFRIRAGNPHIYPHAAIRAELAGHDLACWCPLDQPCHADVLLEIANGGAS